MKRIILLGLLALFNIQSHAQKQQSCYQKYAKVFEVRGANEVEDGTHTEVIITIRKGSFADCFLGKVMVKNGLVVEESIALTFVDESYENLNRAFKYDDPVTISNGISKTMVTNDEELINVMFVDAIKPKKKAFKRAPDPDFEL